MFSTETRRSALADAGWSDVCDRIVAGLCHDLNGRVTSLAGMVQLLQLGDDSSSMAPFLDEEVQRLEKSVALMRGLAGEPLEEPEPIHLPEILPDLVHLASRHRHQELVVIETEIGEGLMPVSGRWTFTGRAVLILCSIAGRESLARSRTLRLSVTRDAEGGTLRVTGVVEGVRGDVDLPPAAGLEEGMPEIARLLGGEWCATDGDDRAEYTLTIPTMGRPG